MQTHTWPYARLLQLILHELTKHFFLFQMYYVVFSDNWSSVMPASWIHIKEKTYRWPPKELNPTKAILRKRDPNSNWTKKNYRRIIGLYGNYNISFIVYCIDNIILMLFLFFRNL